MNCPLKIIAFSIEYKENSFSGLVLCDSNNCGFFDSYTGTCSQAAISRKLSEIDNQLANMNNLLSQLPKFNHV